MAGYILALDQGTTSSRAILYDDHARPIKMVQQPTTLQTPRAGFVEQDAQQIWQTQISCAHDVINRAGLLATDVTSIAITNQRESIVMWDKQTGKPLAPAIIWQDRRTANYCKTLAAESAGNSMNDPVHQGIDSVNMAHEVQRITGLRLDPYFSASKIAWLLENNPKLSVRASRGEIAVGTIDSWLIYKLTGGEHVIDVTNASRTLLFDIHKYYRPTVTLAKPKKVCLQSKYRFKQYWVISKQRSLDKVALMQAWPKILTVQAALC